MRTRPKILKKQRLTAIPDNGMAVIFCSTRTPPLPDETRFLMADAKQFL